MGDEEESRVWIERLEIKTIEEQSLDWGMAGGGDSSTGQSDILDLVESDNRRRGP
jgi:hypothetical protein